MAQGDPKYIEKVYGIMKGGYGDKFTLKPEEFSKKLESDPAYREKIYGIMKQGYGDKFTLTPEDFNTRVGPPGKATPDGLGEPSGEQGKPSQKPSEVQQTGSTVDKKKFSELATRLAQGDETARAEMDVMRVAAEKANGKAKIAPAKRAEPFDERVIDVEQKADASAAYVPRNLQKVVTPEKLAGEFLKETPAYITTQKPEIDAIRQSFGQRTKGVDFDKIVTDNRKTATVGEPLEIEFKNLEEDYLDYLDATNPELGQYQRNKLQALRGKETLLDSEKKWLLALRNDAVEKKNLAAEATMWDVRKVADIDTYQKKSSEIATQLRSIDRQLESLGVGDGPIPPSKAEQAQGLITKREQLVSQYDGLGDDTGFTPELQDEYFGAAKEIIGGEAYVRGASMGVRFPGMKSREDEKQKIKAGLREAANTPVLGTLMGGMAGGKSAVDNMKLSMLQLPKILGDALGDDDYDGFDELYSFAQDEKDQSETLYGNPFGQGQEAPSGYATARMLGEGVGSVAMFIAGGEVAALAKVPQVMGVVGTAFMSGTSDFYEEAIAAGMNPKEAARVAVPVSAAAAAIEGIVPDAKYISPSAFRKSVIRAITSGKPYRVAIKEAIDALPDATRAYLDAAIKEGVEEGAAQLGTDVAKEVSNSVASNKLLDVWNEDAYKQSIMAGALTGGVLNVFARPKSYKASPEQEEVLGYAVDQVEAGEPIDPNTPSLEVVDNAVEIKRGLLGAPSFEKLPVPVQNHVVAELLRKQQLESGMKASGVQPQSTLEEIARIEEEVKSVLDTPPPAEQVKKTPESLQVDEDVQRKVAKPLQEDVVAAEEIIDQKPDTSEAAQGSDITPDGDVRMRVDGVQDTGEGVEVQSSVDGEEVEGDALKDVESTAKAFDDLTKKTDITKKQVSVFERVKKALFPKNSIRLMHGSNIDKINRDDDGLIWFTNDRKVAEDYRKRAIVKNEANLEEYTDEDIESASGIDVIADEQEIDLNKGKVFVGQVDVKNPLDLTMPNDSGNIEDLESLWSKLHDYGLTEKWEDIDSDYQQELIENYEGNAVWLLLEGEGIYENAKRKGFDAVILTDVGVDGKPHKSYGVFGANKFYESSPESFSEAYHAAKKDGSNPELVKAVEELLAPKTEAQPVQETPVFTEREQETESKATPLQTDSGSKGIAEPYQAKAENEIGAGEDVDNSNVKSASEFYYEYGKKNPQPTKSSAVRLNKRGQPVNENDSLYFKKVREWNKKANEAYIKHIDEQLARGEKLSNRQVESIATTYQQADRLPDAEKLLEQYGYEKNINGKWQKPNANIESKVKDIESKAESDSEADLNEAIQKADEVIKAPYAETPVFTEREQEVNVNEGVNDGASEGVNEGVKLSPRKKKAEELRAKAEAIRNATKGTAMLAPKAYAAALDAFATVLETYDDIAQAIAEWRKSKEYKALVDADREQIESEFESDFGDDYVPPVAEKKNKPQGKRFRGTIEAFVEDSDLPEDLKNRMREDPRSYMETLSYEDAKAIVDAMAEAMGGIDALVEDVKKETTRVPLELQSIVLGEGIVHAKNMGKAAKTLEEKDEWADVENELHQLMADKATQAGRYNAYFNQFYDRSDYAVIRRQKQLVDAINKTFSSVKSQEAALDEIKDVLNNPDDAAEAIEEAIQRAVGEAVSERDKIITELEKKIAEFKKAPKSKTVKNKTGRPRRFTEDRLKELRKQFTGELSANPFLDPRRWEYLSYAAGYYLESGYVKFADFFKKMSKETGGKAEEYFAMLYEDAKARLVEDGYTESDFDNAETVERLTEEMMGEARAMREQLEAEKTTKKDGKKFEGRGLEKTIREALIEAGYGKDVNGKMQVDWRKVTGESRDAAPIVEKVKKALEGKIPPSQIDALMPVIEREANRLIMEKKTKAIQTKVKQYETRRRNKLVTRIKRNTRIQGLLETWKQGGLSNKVILDKLADDFGIVTFTEEDEAFVTDLVAQIDAAQIGSERERLEERLQAYLEYNGFPLFLPKVFHERMKSRMLQGFVTFTKNLSGSLDAATDVAHVIALENIKSGGDKQVFKAAFNAHRKAFVTAMDVLLRGGVDMGTAMSEITGNKEGSPSVRWMENPRSDFEGQRIVAKGLRRGVVKFERVFMRALSAADTFNQVMVQEVNAYKAIKATLSQRYPDKSSKEINAMAYEIAFSEELVNARVQARTEFNERIATQKQNIKDAEARIAELQEKISNETGVSELELLNDELAAEQAKIARAQAAIDDLDLTSVLKGGRARFERRVHEIVEQEREKQSPGVTRSVQLAGNIATYKAPDPGVFSGAGILLKQAMTGMYNYISRKKAAAMKDGNAEKVKFYEAAEFMTKITLDYFVPFVGILGNIQEKAMEMTPYGYVKASVQLGKATKEENTGKAFEQMSYYAFRATVGTLLSAIALSLADDDEEDKMARLYGEGPENWNQKKNLAKVRPENTIVVGGARIPLDLMGSWGMPMKMTAKMLDSKRYEKDPLSFIGDLLMTTNSIWFESPARSITSAVFGKDYKQEAQAKKMGAEVVTRATIPGVSFFRQLGQVVSPKAQNPVTFQQQLLKFSGLSGMVGMPAYDYRGKQYDTGQIYTSSADGFVKMFRDEIKIDAVDRLILRAHPGVMTLSRSTENSKIWNEDFGSYDDMSNEEFYRAGLDAAKKFDSLISPLVSKMGKGVDNIGNWGQPGLGLSAQEEYIREAEEQLAAEGKPVNLQASVDLANKLFAEDKVKMAQKKAIQEMNRVAIAASFYDYYKAKSMRIPLPIQEARTEYDRMKTVIDKGYNPFAD